MGGIEYVRKQEYEAMKAEIERLRAALKEVQTEIPAGHVPGWYGACFESIREIVSEALESNADRR